MKNKLTVVMGIATLVFSQSMLGQENKVKTRGTTTSGYHYSHDISNRFSILSSQHHFGIGHVYTEPGLVKVLKKNYQLASDKSSILRTSFMHAADGHYHYKRILKNKDWNNSSLWADECGNYKYLGNTGFKSNYVDHFGCDANTSDILVTGGFFVGGYYRVEFLKFNGTEFKDAYFGNYNIFGETNTYTIPYDNTLPPQEQQDDKMDYIKDLKGIVSVNQDRARAVVQYAHAVPGQFPDIEITDFEFTGSYSLTNLGKKVYNLEQADFTVNIDEGKLVAADLASGEVGALAFKVGSTYKVFLVEPDASGTKLEQKGLGYTLPTSTSLGSIDIEFLPNGKLAIVYEEKNVGVNNGRFKMTFLYPNGYHDAAFGFQTIDILTDGKHFTDKDERTIDISTTYNSNIVHVRQQYKRDNQPVSYHGIPGVLPPIAAYEMAHIRVGCYNIAEKEFTSIKKVDDLYEFPVPGLLNGASIASMGIADAAVAGIDRMQSLLKYDNSALGGKVTHNYLITRFGFESTTHKTYDVDETRTVGGVKVVANQSDFNSIFSGKQLIEIDGDLVLTNNEAYVLTGKVLKFANDSRLIIRNGATLTASNTTFEGMNGETDMKMWEGIQIGNTSNSYLKLTNCNVNDAVVGIRNHLTTLQSEYYGSTDGILYSTSNAGVELTGCVFNDNYISCYLIGGPTSSAVKKIENTTFNFSGNLADPSLFKQGEERFHAHVKLVDMLDKVTFKNNTFKGDKPDSQTTNSDITTKWMRDNNTHGIWSENSLLEFENSITFRNTFEKLSKGTFIKGNSQTVRVRHAKFVDCLTAIDAEVTGTQTLSIRENLIEKVGTYSGSDLMRGVLIQPAENLSVYGFGGEIIGNTMDGIDVGIRLNGYAYVNVGENSMDIKRFGIRAENGQPYMFENAIKGGGTLTPCYGIYLDFCPGAYLSCNKLENHNVGFYNVSPYSGSNQSIGYWAKNEFLSNATGVRLSELGSFTTDVGVSGWPWDNKWSGNITDITAYSDRLEIPGPPALLPSINWYYNASVNSDNYPSNVFTSGYQLNRISTGGSVGGTCNTVNYPEAHWEQMEKNKSVFDQVEDLMSQEKWEEAKELNNSIEPKNLEEENEVWVNGLFLSGFSTDNKEQDDLIRLINLAETCPQEGGVGVYKARVMLSDYDRRYKTMINDCHPKEIGENDDVTGVEDHVDILGVRVFPNPATDMITVQFEEHDALEQTFNVYNTKGQLVKSFEINDFHVEFNISDLDKGVYFYRLDGAGRIGRFVKN